MRLKKIAIFGFKSFADKTVLQFDSGITCIVGPNGCGKSNIADAFRWVLGEQSAKSMRGTKMPDVIFAGASHRKALNYAEVSLTLSDVQGTLPLDYEEITITRRLHRSGESEYLLNGNGVRLKDLQTLFLGSGVGRNAFSIFEQGKLDQVISYSPLERRYIFEEAAGILRFLQRKKEALKRLEMADLNLSRVCDIQKEVEKQVRTLQLQAEKASLFKGNQLELEMLEKTSYLLRFREMKKKQSELQHQSIQLQKKLEEMRSDADLHREKRQEANLANESHEKIWRSLKEKLLSLKAQKEIRANECGLLQERFIEIQKREKKLKLEFEDLFLARQSRKIALEKLESELLKIESECSNAEQMLVSQLERLKAKEMDVVILRQKTSEIQKKHLSSLHQNSQLQSDLKQAQVRLENLQENQKNLGNRQQILKSEKEQLLINLNTRKESLQKISSLVDTHKDRMLHYEEELKKMSLDGEKKQKELESLRRKFMEIKARQNVLLRMREDLEGFSSGSKKLLIEAKNPVSPLYQKLRPLYEFIVPLRDVGDALAVALRSYSQTLVVENEKDVESVIAIAEQMQLQDFSLFCLAWIEKLSNKSLSLEEPLLKAVSENPISRHFLQSIEIESTSQKALESWMLGNGLERWSQEGSFIDHRGVMFKIKPSENHVFMREAELQGLEKELGIKENEIIQCEQALQQVLNLKSRIQAEREESDKILRRDEMKLVEVNFALQRAISDQEKNQTDQKRCDEESKTLTKQLEEQLKLSLHLEQQFEKGELELLSLQTDQEALSQELKAQETELKIHEEDQKQKGSHSLELSKAHQHLLYQCNLLQSKEADHDHLVEKINIELDEIEEKKAHLKQDELKAIQEVVFLEKEIEEKTNAHDSIEKEGRRLREENERTEKELFIRQESLRKSENEVCQLDMQVAHQKTVSQALVEELADRFNLTVEEISSFEVPQECSLEKAEKRAKFLRQAIKDLGDVNLAAIEDLEHQKKRCDFLKEQIGDLTQSKEELMTMVEQLEGESHKLFKETFEAIRQNFKKNFQILFSGGEADLQFTDSEDVLEAGIEIIAQPPGKQMRSISLLSGGEKCLTAVALLFAIFEFKPAPFCILDEIDAPLDDTNVDRFANVVKHFASRCQFLIITHNKRTMAIGDVLFGVTMEEKGVSKLLSLEFAEGEIPETALVS